MKEGMDSSATWLVCDYQESAFLARHQQRRTMPKSTEGTAQRRKLLGQIERLAEIAVFGTLSETYRTCGRAGCRAAIVRAMDPSMVRI